MAREAVNVAELLQRINETSPELKRAWASFDVARLIYFREDILDLLNETSQLAKQGAKDAAAGEGTRLMLDSVSTLEKLMNLLDSLTALKSRVSLDSAAETILSAGFGLTQQGKPTIADKEQYLKRFRDVAKE